jgi:uncharacterized membrane protein
MLEAISFLTLVGGAMAATRFILAQEAERKAKRIAQLRALSRAMRSTHRRP